MDDFRYTYAVARINALSIKLLDREIAARMLGAEPDEILRMLGETAYADSFAGVEDPSQIDAASIRELCKTYDLLHLISPEKDLIDLFRRRYDFYNLKAMLKSRLTGIPYADSIMDLGAYGTDRLSQAVSEQAYRFVPDYIRDTALEATEEFEKTQALYAISYSCDRSMWVHLMQDALKFGNKVVIELFRDYINLANIKTFVRVKEFAEHREVFDRYFIPGGSYEMAFFDRHMDQQLHLFIDHLVKTQYVRRMVSEGFRMWPEDKSFWRLEIACDNFILHRFHEMRNVLFGIAPLIYYLLRKEADAKFIRTVIKCKLIGMRRNKIEERVRYLYV